ncbi:hypothetical protein Nepgr_025603 [Nepenthes gracilis]|uniref:Glycosyltransferase n=1 Tax=Nepenthes gracilis TaxID=150966 RepID=A0AAD3Y178_NEPGR|nr:hypothetical protein Nepgr_025603 [Nepenthes gracilis]
MAKLELLFIPPPLPGHVVSTVEFARGLLKRDSRFSATILVMKSPFGAPPSTDSKTNSATTTLADATSAIRLVSLPEVERPPPELFKECMEKYVTQYVESHKPHVRDAVSDLLNSGANPSSLAGLVVDVFTTSMIDVANELGVPSYLFFTSGAAMLGLVLHLPTHYDRVGTGFSESDHEIIVPSFKNPIPVSTIPSFLLTKTGYITFDNHSRRFRETKGILVNTFAELEPYAINSFLGGQTPPVYTVGPILDLSGDAHGRTNSDKRDRIMKWLDAKPESSVIFLCFGSAGSMHEAQVKEVARGLMRSRTRFLWSVRKPPPEGAAGGPTDYTDEDLKDMLPEFASLLEEGTGMVCGWAPQAEVLAHDAIGGFVSHCGWNSVLESLWFGRPIVTWPMYAEQQSNAFLLARELGLAVEMRLAYGGDSGDLVVADELETAIRRLMDEDNEVRRRVKEVADIGRGALLQGGSSYNSVGRFIDDVIGNHR